MMISSDSKLQQRAFIKCVVHLTQFQVSTLWFSALAKLRKLDSNATQVLTKPSKQNQHILDPARWMMVKS